MTVLSDTIKLLPESMQCRKDATLKEVLTTLRLTAPQSAELRHPLAKFSLRALYADSAARGRIASKDLGMVYSRDILGEPGTIDSIAPRLLEDDEQAANDRERDDRTLDELRFVPGDYLCVSVILPKHATHAGGAADVTIKGAAVSNGWKSARPPSPGPPGGLGRGGGHWRGGSDSVVGRGRGGRMERPRRDIERDLDDRDRRIPPPRRVRDLSPPRGGGFGRDFGRDRRSKSRSRSYSPPRRRNNRYD